MQKKRIVSLLLAAFCVLTLFVGCKNDTDQTKNSDSDGEHEPIVMQMPFRNMGAFLDKVHEKYPEINLQFDAYSGANFTAYINARTQANDIPDIYCRTYYVPEFDDMSDLLIDLSGYSFTDNYAEVRLRDVSDNGAIYLLPTYFECFGITYNKTLLEKHGWTLPTNFKELEELAVKAKEAGVNLCLTEIQFPGYGFQYLCNILDTGYLNTIEGRKWQTAYVNGEATIEDSPEMMENLQTLQKWRDLGMLNGDGDPVSDSNTKAMMAEGNTLFLLGSTNKFKEEETTDEFGLMPYLSEDGTRNAYILNVSRYVGLSKKLLEPGNEQKLQDALHVMEVMSSVEGMEAMNSAFLNTSLLPLKDYTVKDGGYYSGIEDQLNSGMTAPFIYSGWAPVIANIGETVISFIKGEASLDDIAKSFDDNQYLLKDNSDSCVTTVTEKIDQAHCAQLVGIVFAKASGADLALISKNKWYKLDKYDSDLNLDGVSGALYPMQITDEEIVSILPTGWRKNIQTVTLTGARIKELAEKGYDRLGSEMTFPYELVVPEGFVIDDSATYTVVIAGATDAVKEEGNITDTGILGLEAMRDFLKKYQTFSLKDIVWEK